MAEKTPKVIISSSQQAMRVPRKEIARLVAFVARQEGVRIAQIDIAVVNSNSIASVNQRFLGHRGATDVISFDLSDSSQQGIVAQLVVCGDVAARQGPLHGLSPRRELLLYVVHGLLHLMGYDDTTIRGSARMHAREDEILAAFE